MEAFNTIWLLIQCFFWLCFLAITLMVMFTLVVAVFRETMKILRPRSKAHRQKFMDKAQEASKELLTSKAEDPWLEQRGFKRGAEWAWDNKLKP